MDARFSAVKAHHVAKFWSLVIKGKKPKDCWDWRGYFTGSKRYLQPALAVGGFRERSHDVAAAVFSYWLANGIDPITTPTKLVCHTCDNPRCVNPKHLFLGTARINTLDAAAKGLTCRGADMNTSKISDPSVVFSLSAQGLNQTQIAKKLGVHQSSISRILHGINHKYHKR